MAERKCVTFAQQTGDWFLFHVELLKRLLVKKQIVLNRLIKFWRLDPIKPWLYPELSAAGFVLRVLLDVAQRIFYV